MATGNYVGPGSTFAAVCNYSSYKDNGNGTYTVTFSCYISVQAGSSGFQGTNVITNWSAGTVALYKSDAGSGTKTVTVNYGQTASFTANAYYTSGSGKTYSSSATASYTYKPTYAVTYNANGGTGAPGNQTKTYGTNLTLSSTKPTKPGYTFSKWNTKSDGSGTSYNAGASYTSNAALTLYAIWTENKLTINYYSNYATEFNGTTTPDNAVNNNNVKIYGLNYFYDNAYSDGLPNYPSGSVLGMVRTGYTATGYWGTSTDGGTLVHMDTAFDTGQALAQAFGLSLETGNATIDVYAQWSENKLTVNYYSNYATSFEGDVTPKNEVGKEINALIWTQNYYYDNKYSGALINYSLPTNDLYMIRKGYKPTEYWGTELEGGILIHQDASFDTGQALAQAFGKDLSSGNATIDIYAQWEKSTSLYKYKDGQWIAGSPFPFEDIQGFTYVYKDGDWRAGI